MPPSALFSAFWPTACETNGSHSPSDAEITSGLNPEFCSGEVSAFSAEDSSALDS